MPQLKWSETDFLECFEIIPKVDEYEVQYIYDIRQDELALTVSVWPYESVVLLSLCQQNRDVLLTQFALFVRGDVRYVNDKRGRYLSFQDCVILPSRFYRLRVDDGTFGEATTGFGLNIEITNTPHIQIRHLYNE